MGFVTNWWILLNFMYDFWFLANNVRICLLSGRDVSWDLFNLVLLFKVLVFLFLGVMCLFLFIGYMMLRYFFVVIVCSYDSSCVVVTYVLTNFVFVFFGMEGCNGIYVFLCLCCCKNVCDCICIFVCFVVFCCCICIWRGSSMRFFFFCNFCFFCVVLCGCFVLFVVFKCCKFGCIW